MGKHATHRGRTATEEAAEPGVLAQILSDLDGQELTAETLGTAYQAVLAKNRGKRQQAGAFYTPRYVVEFVLMTSLLPALNGRIAEEILDLTVLDPACGSGMFLALARAAIERRLVELGRRPGPELRGEITRRCLRGVDIDPIAVSLCRLGLAQDADVELDDVPITCADSLLSKPSPADVLITNPPWGQKNLHFDDATKRELRKRYATARGVLDPFKLFVELAMSITAPGGRWAMVLPDIVLLKNHEATRRMMLGGSSLEWIAHIGRPFRGVNLDACVIGARMEAAANDHEVSTLASLDSDWASDDVVPHMRAQLVFAGLDQARLNVVASDDDLARVERFATLARVGDRFEAHEGVHTGNRRGLLFVSSPSAPSSRILVGGPEIAPFQLRWDGRFIDLDPATVDRNNGGYANLGQPSWHLRKKIVVRRTGDSMIAAFDRLGSYVSNNFFVVVPRFVMSDIELRAFTAILGSSLMTWYFRTVQPRAGRIFAELKIVHLTDFPLAPMSYPEARSLAVGIEMLERPGLSDSERGRLVAALDRQVDALYDRIE